MDELLSEIDNNICQNLKSISFVRKKKKIFNKMRAKSTILNIKKKIYSASYLFNSKPNKKKILGLTSSKSNLVCSSANKYLSLYSKKHYSSLSSNTCLSSIKPREELSTSLSTLIKPIPTLMINNSKNNTSTNYYINSDINNLDSNNTYNINSLNNNSNSNIIDKINIDDKYYFLPLFDEETARYLNHNSLFNYKKAISSHDFIEKSRIIRKNKIIKNHCQKKVVALKEIKEEELNKMDKIIFTYRKNLKLFYSYFKTLNYYLNKLSDIKEEEDVKLSKLKLQKTKIIYQMKVINNSLIVKKQNLMTLKELKKFLLEAKFGNFVSNIPLEIKKKYGFSINYNKGKAKKIKSNYGGRISFLARMDKYRRKNSVVMIQGKNLNLDNNANKNLSFNNCNIPIFDYPEQLINSINRLNDKLSEDMILYKKSRASVNEYKNTFETINQDYNKVLVNYIKEEKKLLNNLNYQKRRNNMLNKKINSFNKSEINKKNTLIKIVLKLKNILLEVNTMIKIKNKIDTPNWNSIISNNNNFEDINTAISNSYYILKLLERIIEDLIYNKNKFKKDVGLKDEYKKVHNEIEKINNIKRYKLQISLTKKKNEEKNKKVIEKNKKTRYGSLYKNKIIAYEDKIKEKLLSKKNMSLNKIKKLNNFYDESKEWLSFY